MDLLLMHHLELLDLADQEVEVMVYPVALLQVEPQILAAVAAAVVGKTQVQVVLVVPESSSSHILHKTNK